MRVLVPGAYGLIGSACLARLRSEGHELIGLGRSIDQARWRFPYARWITADFAKLTDPAAWQAFLQGIDAVVNCVGVLQNGLGDSVKRVQLDATVALFKACERAGIRRVQIRMRDIAQRAAKTGKLLPREYRDLFRVWFWLGWPAFCGVLGIFGLMVWQLRFG